MASERKRPAKEERRLLSPRAGERVDIPFLILVGFVYICETLSVILQVGYFKLTHGKRLFKMSPIHHHFEMCGWKEVKIVLVFTTVSAVMCALAWFGIGGLIG